MRRSAVSRVHHPWYGWFWRRAHGGMALETGRREDAGMLLEQQVQLSAVALNYAEGPPNGPPLVILHGGAGSWQSGAALIDALVEQWHVFAPDLRGHGRSGHVAGRYSLRDYASDTAEFLARVVAAPAVLYGHSLGGE